MLEVRALAVHYGKALALQGVELEVPEHSLVSVIGPNGAGKTTLLRAISGLLRPSAGEVRFRGSVMNGVAAHRVVREGLVHCPEGRRPFPEMSVADNLLLGAPLWPSAAEARRAWQRCWRSFRGCRSASHRWPERSPAASSRWSRSAAR
jgi:branched-chain amino acid transport system ATP-binding protein